VGHQKKYHVEPGTAAHAMTTVEPVASPDGVMSRA